MEFSYPLVGYSVISSAPFGAPLYRLVEAAGPALRRTGMSPLWICGVCII